MGYINFGVAPDIADQMASCPDDKGTVVVVGAGCAGKYGRTEQMPGGPAGLVQRGCRAGKACMNCACVMQVSAFFWRAVHAAQTCAHAVLMPSTNQCARPVCGTAPPAGLAAARQLRMLGYRVVVVEGRDRPGGRVYTMRMGVSLHSLDQLVRPQLVV